MGERCGQFNFPIFPKSSLLDPAIMVNESAPLMIIPRLHSHTHTQRKQADTDR